MGHFWFFSLFRPLVNDLPYLLADYTVIAVFVIILSVGLAMSRKASTSLEGLFLSGRNLPLVHARGVRMSGWFDLAGTMIITRSSIARAAWALYRISVQAEQYWCSLFMLAYIGKWHRRSGCMTAAEWDTYRFGTGFSGS